jgi:hypothetical protein
MFEQGRLLDGAGRFNVRDAIIKMTMLPDITLDAQRRPTSSGRVFGIRPA